MPAFDGGKQRRRALDVAGRAGAHDAGVFAFGLECEEVVEGGGAIDAAERHPQRSGDEPQRDLIQIPEALLHRVEGFDERVRFAPVTACRRLDDFPPLVVRGQLRALPDTSA